MIDNIIKALKWLFSSLDTHTTGMSLRKFVVVFVLFLMYRGREHYLSDKNFSDVDTSDKVFIGIMAGVVTIDQLIRVFLAKNGTTTTEKTIEVTEKTTETKEE